MDPFVVLAAASQVTKTIKFGTGVLLVQQRDAIQMDDAEPDVPAYMTFPKDHRPKLHSTNPQAIGLRTAPSVGGRTFRFRWVAAGRRP